MSHCWRHSGRQLFIGLPLLATIMLTDCGVGWGAESAPRMRQEQPARITTARQKNIAPQAADESRVEIERLKQPARKKKAKDKVGNAFGATSWYVPPPPPAPVKPPPPPPPAAPPMPFTYLGLYEEAAGKTVMLLRGGHVYTVAVGDVIENIYRVDSVENGVVEMTYLPLNIKQSINTGNSL